MTETPIPPAITAFREGMSRLGAAVNLVTTDGPAGRHGMIVSAVCSVTDSPPMLLACINQNAYAHDAFLANGTLCVNVLRPGHRDLSRAFTKWTGEDRFSQAGWDTLETGAPVLQGAAVAFDCRIIDRQQKGTHSVLFCEVAATRLWSGTPEGLIWFSRAFHQLEAAAG
ncbi:flavin reductase [Pannonibacter indicus]|uniref:flavin reductase n=1 Tax=Pannonibacter indicus TaxID=466044 RepID=UPI0035AFD3C1